MNHVIIGTRGSSLALWQAEFVARSLEQAFPGLVVELKIIKTTGDKILDVPLANVGGKGLFVKEIEEELLRKEVDVAVHSIKDVPAELVPGLQLTAIPVREDPRDALISRQKEGLLQLPRGARIGTSSLRRKCQLLHLRPDLQLIDLRGNVDTRLTKLKAGMFDAILLAAAGLMRLGYIDQASELLCPKKFIPAVGQGALGIETRIDDLAVNELIAVLHHEPTACCVQAERAFLARVGGGCQVPVAAHAVLKGETILLDALIGYPSGEAVYRDHSQGHKNDVVELGTQLAERLLDQGGKKILEELYSAGGEPAGYFS